MQKLKSICIYIFMYLFTGGWLGQTCARRETKKKEEEGKTEHDAKRLQIGRNKRKLCIERVKLERSRGQDGQKRNK